MPLYPPASSTSTPGENRIPTADFTLATGYSLMVIDYFEPSSGVVVEVASDAVIEVDT